MAVLVETITSQEALAALEPEWVALARTSRNTLPFRTYAWAACWWKHMAQDRALVRDSLAFRAVRDEGGALVAVAPLMLTERPSIGPLRARCVQFIGADPNMTEVRGMLAAPGREKSAYAAIREDLVAASSSFDWVRFTGIDARSGALETGERPALEWGAGVSCYVLDLPSSWEALRASRSRNIKESLRKGYNSLRRDGLEPSLEVVTSGPQVRGAVDDFLRLHQARADAEVGGVPHRNVFSHPARRAFLRDVCVRFAAAGELAIFRLRVGGALVATRVGFVLGGSLYLYYSGYDPAYAKYGVMTTTVAEAMKYAIGQGLSSVNLSTGTDGSKLRWGPREEAYREALFVPACLRSRVALDATATATRTLSRPSLRRYTDRFFGRRASLERTLAGSMPDPTPARAALLSSLVSALVLIIACSAQGAHAPGLDALAEGAGGASPGAGMGGSGGNGGQSALGGMTGAAACGPLPQGAGGGSGPPGITVVSQGPLSASEHEPHIARSPSGALAVVWIAYGAASPNGIGYSISSDGGLSWSAPQQIQPPIGTHVADPSVVADACGDFHVAFLSYSQMGSSLPTDARVFVASAPAGALAFGPPVLASGVGAGDADKPWLAVTHSGALVTCWTGGGGVSCARSEGAAAWSMPKLAAIGGDIELPYLCASPDDARTYLVFMTLAGPRLAWSDDDGVTWPPSSVRAIAKAGETNVGVLDPPSCVVSAGELTVAYGVSTEAAPVSTSPRLSAIRVARSNDHGATFGIYASVTPPAPLTMMHPTLARSSDGTLHVAYYQGGTDGDPGGTFTYARALPGTLAFSPPSALASVAFVTSRGAAAWAGDYAGLIAEGGRVRAAFAGATGAGPAHVSVVAGP